MMGRSRSARRDIHAFGAHVSSRFSAVARGRVRLAVVGMSAMALLCLAGPRQARASSGLLAIDERIDRQERRFTTRLDGWRAHLGDVAGAEATAFDASTWEHADIGYRWEIPYSVCWFRRWIEVPERVGGVRVKGARLGLRISIDNGGSIYVNGVLKQAVFERSGGYAVLTESARPGERYLVAVRGINRPGWGALLGARLESSAAAQIVPAVSALLQKLKFVRHAS